MTPHSADTIDTRLRHGEVVTAAKMAVKYNLRLILQGQWLGETRLRYHTQIGRRGIQIQIRKSH